MIVNSVDKKVEKTSYIDWSMKQDLIQKESSK